MYKCLQLIKTNYFPIKFSVVVNFPKSSTCLTKELEHVSLSSFQDLAKKLTWQFDSCARSNKSMPTWVQFSRTWTLKFNLANQGTFQHTNTKFQTLRHAVEKHVGPHYNDYLKGNNMLIRWVAVSFMLKPCYSKPYPCQKLNLPQGAEPLLNETLISNCTKPLLEVISHQSCSCSLHLVCLYMRG
jgi:hypothetical protein